ncbi:MAG: deoxyribodipyrimidine photo-lyase [Rhodobacteraceae bacterium]|nr:deoxyribodipyrimidine photo-lyase [Paracoccaceae bacterium]
MSDTSPLIFWLRRDLRLSDHQGLSAAAASGRPVIPVFIHDETVEALGAAPKFRMGRALEEFSKTLEGIGSRLVFRRGRAQEVLDALVAETGAGAVWWSRLYDPEARELDGEIKGALRARGIEARSFSGHLLFEPWEVETKTGGFYKVYSPYWRAVRGNDPGSPLPRVKALRGPDVWPRSDQLTDWRMDAAMNRGAAVLAPHLTVGEEAAADRLGNFIDEGIARYGELRDIPSVDGTSRLSENLTYGEISPRACWHAGMRAMEEGQQGAEKFVKEVVWREFAYHLVYHTPWITHGNWRREWDAFPWNEDDTRPEVLAWKQGRTGIRFVDAAMRELHVTGYMHNRARMIAASYLTKHLMTHWRVGLKWFEEHLVDWDPAANAMGWQWAAGSGPDASPYFRVFNPESQLEKFDPKRTYARRWIAEGQRDPGQDALAYFDAVPRRWGLSPEMAYPAPVVTAEAGRKAALAAYETRSF